MYADKLEVLMIGRNIPWADIKGEFLRVELFLPLSTIEGKEIKSLSLFEARAYLKVHSPHLKYEGANVYLPVLHKLDFRHLWELYQVRSVLPEEEVLVIYKPSEEGFRKLFGKTFPHLFIEVRPRGSLEEIYNYFDAVEQGTIEAHLDTTLQLHKRTAIIAAWEPIDGRVV